jgi:hypothetical protein
VVEFSSLFTNFLSINGEKHFDQLLSSLLSREFTHLFFYYTGHGIKSWTRSTKLTISLIIPGHEGTAEFYTRESLQKRFNQIRPNVAGLIVFDCCHAEYLLKLPYKVTFPLKDPVENQGPNFTQNLIYISSTRSDQTCGFYVAPNEPYGGSLFTCYFIQFLSMIGREISSKKTCRRKLLSLSQLEQVEKKVQQYRNWAEKKPQNMSIGLTHKETTHLPNWLFQNRRIQLVEDAQ